MTGRNRCGRIATFRAAALGGAMLAISACAAGESGLQNIALGRPYTMRPHPNYRLCTDPGDRTQLTDGVYSKGYFWVQKTTVGWRHASPVVIQIDLGRDRPIRGVSVNTAAGTAGVTWPASIWILVSPDKQRWYAVADLVEETAKTTDLPPPQPYRVFRYHTESLRTHGRYVTLVVDVVGPYFFTDEIEVFEGAPEWLHQPVGGVATLSPLEFYRHQRLSSLVRRRLRADLQSVRKLEVPAAIADRVQQEAARIENAIAALPPPDPAGFKTVLPLNRVHADIFRLAGIIRAASGQPTFSAWPADPWAFLEPLTAPPETPPSAVRIAAMRGETRSGAVNLAAAGEQPVTVRIVLDGVDTGNAGKAGLTFYRVPWTDTREGTPVAAALVRLPDPVSGCAEVKVHPGLTAQVWISFRPPRSAAAGARELKLRLVPDRGKEVVVPLYLRVFDLDFPKRPTLHLGGWDYTNQTPYYGLTEKNFDAFLGAMRRYQVDCPWATARALPFPGFDPNGAMVKPPDTTNFDRWVRNWPDAARYSVFVAVRDNIAGVKTNDSRFPRMVGAWIRFWTQHALTRGVPPEKLYLLLVDEPHSREQDAVIVAWARAVKAAAPKVNVWEDPTWRDPTKALPDLFEVADVLCPNRPMMLAQGKRFENFYRNLRAGGKRLDFYSCSGPARLLDPYAYYRLQAWTCFDMGAGSEFFWALADNAGGNSWNEYLLPRTSFTPFFLDAESVTPAKQIEGIREGREDFDYLTMLRHVSRQLKTRQPGSALAARAEKLLQTACRRVLDIPKPDELQWTRERDRTVADAVRIEIGEFLETCRRRGVGPTH